MNVDRVRDRVRKVEVVVRGDILVDMGSKVVRGCRD